MTDLTEKVARAMADRTLGKGGYDMSLESWQFDEDAKIAISIVIEEAAKAVDKNMGDRAENDYALGWNNAIEDSTSTIRALATKGKIDD